MEYTSSTAKLPRKKAVFAAPKEPQPPSLARGQLLSLNFSAAHFLEGVSVVTASWEE